MGELLIRTASLKDKEDWLMKGKKWIAMLVLLSMTASMVLGCGSSAGTDTADSDSGEEAAETESTPASDGEKMTLNIWMNSDGLDEKEAIIEEFNAAHDDIEVVAAYYDTDGLKEQLKVAASSNTLPDAWKTYGGSFGQYFVDNGLAADVTDYAEEHGWSDYFLEGPLQLCYYNDKLYGYPHSYNVVAMWYRKDLFEQAGVEVPTTFDEFLDSCAKLKEAGITPVSTSALYGWHVMRLIELFIEHYAGAELHDQLNALEADWNCQEVIDAFTTYQEFCEKGYFPEGFLTGNPDDTRMAVYTGDCAMDVDGQWFDSYLLDDEMDFDNYGYFVLPTSGTNRVSAFVEMFQFSKDITPERMDACVEFMDYMYSNETMAKYGNGFNLPLPIVGADEPEGQPHVMDLFEESSANGTFTILDQAFPAEVADVLFNAEAAIANGEMTPEEAAAQIQEAIETYKANNAE